MGNLLRLGQFCIVGLMSTCCSVADLALAKNAFISDKLGLKLFEFPGDSSGLDFSKKSLSPTSLDVASGILPKSSKSVSVLNGGINACLIGSAYLTTGFDGSNGIYDRRHSAAIGSRTINL